MSNLTETAQRCLKCKKPLCSAHCPVSTPIPQAMTLFENGELRAAGELLFANNPLSAICSIICPHERNCYGNCVLNRKGTPVDFYNVEQYISGFYLDTFVPPHIDRNGINIAVVGAGPGGLSMAVLLALRGYSVTIYDKKDKIGGILRYGIPEFRLPKRILDTYEEMLYSLGVKIRFNTPVGQSITADDMFADGFAAVFLATGTSRPNKLGLLGETLGNVHYAIDYLKSPSSYHLGQNIAIIGAGNVAMDAARSAVRTTHGHVFVIHHKDEQEMTGSRDEIEMAKIEGVEFCHLCSTVRITESEVVCVRMNVTENEDGTRDFTEDFGSVIRFPADSVILALGQGPQAEYVKNMADIDTTGRGLIAVDDTGRTSKKGVFAAGDIVTGPRTVVEAVAQSKRIAETIDEYLKAAK